MWHEVAIRHRLGPLTLDVDFEVRAPWTVLFAPSGAGKTTLLRMIAGLERPDQGRIVSHVLFPPMPARTFVLTDTVAKVFLPTYKRVVRMVAQRPALFPHMTVMNNIYYRTLGGQRDAEERESRERGTEELLKLCRVGHLRDKMPEQLSGGERQRVALARAIGTGAGRLLMLDEPFTGLEASLRDELILDLKAWIAKRGTPVLLVTHDVAEALLLQAEVIKIAEGRIVAQGPAADVLAEERERLLGVLK
jgi:molybdate transport system ATP-binding protein